METFCGYQAELLFFYAISVMHLNSTVKQLTHNCKANHCLKQDRGCLSEMLLWQLSMNVQSFVPHDGHVLQCYSAMKTTMAYTQNNLWLYKELHGFKLDNYQLYGFTIGSCSGEEPNFKKVLETLMIL